MCLRARSRSVLMSERFVGGGISDSCGTRLSSARLPAARHLAALFAGLVQADRDRLLSAAHLGAAPSALQLAALHLVHRSLHLRLGFGAIAGHGSLLAGH